MADVSAATEARALGEYWALLRDPVYRGHNVPHGDGRLVLVLPGLFGNDFYLQPLRSWLARIGYQPVMSNIALNAGCPDRIRRTAQNTFEARLARHDGEVAIIGHSRGGMLGKSLVTRVGARCTRFVAIGSPVGTMLRAGVAGLQALASGSSAGSNVASRNVMDAGRAAMRMFDPNCNSPLCGCAYIDDLLAPFPATTRVTAIYSADDPIVAPAACPIDGADNHEVSGSHGGLVANRQVYSLIAAALA